MSGFLLVVATLLLQAGGGDPMVLARPPVPPSLEFTGPGEAWPPAIRNARPGPILHWTPRPGALTDSVSAEMLRVALASPAVREALGSRFAYIGISQVEHIKGDPSPSLRARLMFFSHSRNVAVEVTSGPSDVESVASIPGMQPSEGLEEAREAVALARADPRLTAVVESLEGHALLAERHRTQEGFGHRVLYVTFSAPDETLARLAAMVDLTDERVFDVGSVRKGAQ